MMPHSERTPEEISRGGWLFYDDQCSFCRTWVPFWRPSLNKRGFDIAPLQSEWVSRQLGLDPVELLKDVRLLSADGTRIEGADVYRFLMKRIWWSYPFYLLSVVPGFRMLFNRLYRRVAAHRYG